MKLKIYARGFFVMQILEASLGFYNSCFKVELVENSFQGQYYSKLKQRPYYLDFRPQTNVVVIDQQHYSIMNFIVVYEDEIIERFRDKLLEGGVEFEVLQSYTTNHYFFGKRGL